jgi:hypothetical protein
MGPTAWTARQKTLQAWKIGPESGVGPSPEDLLPERLEASPGQEPTADPPWSGLGERGQHGPYLRRHTLLKHPGDESGPHGCFHTRGMWRAELIEAEELFHPLQHTCHLPARPVQT